MHIKDKWGSCPLLNGKVESFLNIPNFHRNTSFFGRSSSSYINGRVPTSDFKEILCSRINILCNVQGANICLL